MPFCDRTFIRVAVRETIRDMGGALHSESDLLNHLRAAIEWLALAQDQTGDGGVSAGFGRTGWRPSYPEITGYVIPTFIDHSHLTGEESYLERANRMGDFELGVHMENGAIPCGYKNRDDPCIFDTGQVITGWLALYNEFGDQRFLDAARHAGDWLLSVQAHDGSWGGDGYMQCSRTYHTLTTSAVVKLGQVADDPRYIHAARSNLAWAIANQNPNGWFAHAELHGDRYPVTHTMAYTIQGILESGIALQEPTYVSAARKAADALLEKQLSNGSFQAMFDSEWKPMVKYCSLTGCVQMAVNWFRLYEITNDVLYLQSARRANAFVRRTQDLTTKDPVRGAIKGSFPLYGRYEWFSYPTWATKFFADAHILEVRHTNHVGGGLESGPPQISQILEVQRR